MSQAKHPTFAEIKSTLDYVNIHLGSPEEELIDARVICRVYDRRSGNFKACGWHVRLQYASGWSGRSVPCVIFDSDQARSKLT